VRSFVRRSVAAGTVAAATVAVSLLGAAPASADDEIGGVYICYNVYTIEVTGVAKIPYVVPAAVTTDPKYCPYGTVWLGAG
jgi:hypothetical protein